MPLASPHTGRPLCLILSIYLAHIFGLIDIQCLHYFNSVNTLDSGTTARCLFTSPYNLLFSLEVIIVLVFVCFFLFFLLSLIGWLVFNELITNLSPASQDIQTHQYFLFVFNVFYLFEEISSWSLLACSLLGWFIFGLPALILGSPPRSLPGASLDHLSLVGSLIL